jgi:NodT family efflux transporter outer membrane factor (OMF) lipoprotein
LLLMNVNSAWLTGLLVFLLSACTAGPDFVRPSIPPAVWHAPLPHGGKVADLLRWWTQWDDPVLSQLIEQAEQHNPSLDMAVAKLAEARANANISDASSYPSVGANLGATRSKMVFGTQVIEQTQDSLKFDAGWEIDLFGRVRRGREAALARVEAGIEGWHEARISLAAEVASAYVELRVCESGAELSGKVLASRGATRDLSELKHQAGFTSTADSARIQAAVEEAAAALVARRGDCTRQLNRLVALTGRDYDNLQDILRTRHARLPAPQQIELEQVAAQALSQRPDVAGAAFDWAAASAEVGVAKADLYPGMNLLGSIGVNRFITAGTTSKASTWSFGPAIKIPLFDGGSTAGQVKAAIARYDFAEANYRKTVRAAVQEIENGLVNLEMANQRTARNREALGHYQTLSQAGIARREAGLGNQLEVEDLQRNTWLAEDNLLGSQRDSALAWIALYKALGGSWQREAASVEEK